MLQAWTVSSTRSAFQSHSLRKVTTCPAGTWPRRAARGLQLVIHVAAGAGQHRHRNLVRRGGRRIPAGAAGDHQRLQDNLPCSRACTRQRPGALPGRHLGPRWTPCAPPAARPAPGLRPFPGARARLDRAGTAVATAGFGCIHFGKSSCIDCENSHWRLKVAISASCPGQILQ